jgi:hypothetical protein
MIAATGGCWHAFAPVMLDRSSWQLVVPCAGPSASLCTSSASFSQHRLLGCGHAAADGIPCRHHNLCRAGLRHCDAQRCGPWRVNHQCLWNQPLSRSIYCHRHTRITGLRQPEQRYGEALTTLRTHRDVCARQHVSSDTLVTYPWQVGLVIQRGGVILVLSLLPMISIFLNAEHILLGIHQDPQVCPKYSDVGLLIRQVHAPDVMVLIGQRPRRPVL